MVHLELLDAMKPIASTVAVLCGLALACSTAPRDGASTGAVEAGAGASGATGVADGAPPARSDGAADAADAAVRVAGREHQSCDGLPPTCGVDQEDCCTSLLVPGGTFIRDYDGVLTLGPEWISGEDPPYPVDVSSFRLDKFEVTVGRFRKFVAASLAGWVPVSGDGKHTHLNGGQGLTLADGSGYEPGFWWAAHEGVHPLLQSNGPSDS